MKKIIKLTLLSFSIIAFGLAGCSKDDDEENNTGGNNNNNTGADSIAPVVALNGAATFDVILNGTFTDPGATATDNSDPTLTIITTGSVNVNHTGDYSLTYSTTDSSGNTGSAVRIVHVYNQAEIFAGIYSNSLDTCNMSPTSVFNANVTVSDTINKLISIGNFGAFGTNVHVNATITALSNGAAISIQSGQSLGGTATVQNIFSSETIVISVASTATSFKVKYQWGDGTVSDICTSTYIR